MRPTFPHGSPICDSLLRLYYLSDARAEQRRNLWAYDPRARTRRQVARFGDYDIRNPSIGPDAIVFELGPDLHLFIAEMIGGV